MLVLGELSAVVYDVSNYHRLLWYLSYLQLSCSGIWLVFCVDVWMNAESSPLISLGRAWSSPHPGQPSPQCITWGPNCDQVGTGTQPDDDDDSGTGSRDALIWSWIIDKISRPFNQKLPVIVIATCVCLELKYLPRRGYLFMLCCPASSRASRDAARHAELHCTALPTYVIPDHNSEAGEHCTWPFREGWAKDCCFDLEWNDWVQLEALSIYSCLSALVVSMKIF